MRRKTMLMDWETILLRYQLSLHNQWQLNRVWLSKKTHRTQNGKAYKSTAYCRRRIYYNIHFKGLSATLSILERSRANWNCPPSVRFTGKHIFSLGSETTKMFREYFRESEMESQLWLLISCWSHRHLCNVTSPAVEPSQGLTEMRCK